jgi:hypothetical protein
MMVVGIWTHRRTESPEANASSTVFKQFVKLFYVLAPSMV